MAIEELPNPDGDLDPPKPPMTEREALTQTRNLWRWLERNPGTTKYDYYARHGDPTNPEHAAVIQDCVYDCPCCEYVCRTYPSQRSDGMSCHNAVISPKELGCPLHTLWPSGCCKDSSPFIKFCFARTSDPQRTTYAKAIADACDTRLKDLNGNQPQ